MKLRKEPLRNALLSKGCRTGFRAVPALSAPPDRSIQGGEDRGRQDPELPGQLGFNEDRAPNSGDV